MVLSARSVDGSVPTLFRGWLGLIALMVEDGKSCAYSRIVESRIFVTGAGVLYPLMDRVPSVAKADHQGGATSTSSIIHTFPPTMLLAAAVGFVLAGREKEVKERERERQREREAETERERRARGESDECSVVKFFMENPDIVLVHYLNVPAVDDSGKPCGPVLCSINTDRKEWAKWSKEELIGQLKPMCAGSSLHQKCSSVKQRIISSKQEPGPGALDKTEEADGSEVQNSDVSEGQTETSSSTAGSGRSRVSERRNGRLPKPSLLPQSSMEVSSSTNTAQVEVPDTPRARPLHGLRHGRQPRPVHGPGLNQSTAVFMSEVTTLTGESVYSTGHTHLLGPAHEAILLQVWATGILLAVTPENSQRFPTFSRRHEFVPTAASSCYPAPSTDRRSQPARNHHDLRPRLLPQQPQTGPDVRRRRRQERDLQQPRRTPLPANVFYNSEIVNNIKTEAASLDQPLTNQSGYESTGSGGRCRGRRRSDAESRAERRGGDRAAAARRCHLQGKAVEQASLGLLQETGRLFGVTDYSPEWSYPEGGVKVLITGPWLESSSDYSCFFDHISVPAL
ncbi:hypothetical protein WMY93_033042 [Mugilogobius chulae]|uniref:Uncharacterized protein n=1 Tax=Mugilogobius chulae TaxID=88201 RepID=A0AAW0MPR8_9GOBI